MSENIIIVDDFYAAPDAVREFALQQKYTDFAGKKAFLGKETEYPYFDKQTEDRFSDLVGTPITYTHHHVFGKFRLAGQSEERRTKIHFDRSAWAANIYLTPELGVECGLGIYRHKKLGLDRVPTEDQLEPLGYSSLDDFDAEVVVRDSLDSDAWEMIDLIEPRYNRLVILPGRRFFHAAEQGAGSSHDEARLSQHFFFEPAHE